MPKLLVLVGGGDDEVMAVAEAIHEGARSVRFAESDLRRVPGEPGTERSARLLPFDDVDALLAYDAIVLGAPAAGSSDMAGLLERARPMGLDGKLANKLGSIFPASDSAMTGEQHPLWRLLAPMARFGMILVPPGYAGPSGQPEDQAASARRLGRRLIDIAAWITHARSHHQH